MQDQLYIVQHMRIFDKGCVIAEFIFALMPMTITLVPFYTEKCFVKFCAIILKKIQKRYPFFIFQLQKRIEVVYT